MVDWTNRIQELHEKTAYPESRSVMKAMLQLANEIQQHYAKLEAELHSMTARYDAVKAKYDFNCNLLAEGKAENQKLRDALKFYANESNWLDILDDVPAVFDDRGKIATKALEDKDG